MAVVLAFAMALATAVAATGAAPPESGRIAFVNNGGLHMIAPDGSGLVVLRQSGCGATQQAPCPFAKALSWSPDGHRLAFVFGTQLHLLDSRDSTQRVLPTGVDVSGTSAPAWSPDGRRLAFLSLDVVDEGGTLSDLHVIDVDTGTVRMLVGGGLVADGLAWAPAAQIVYASLVSGAPELFVIDPDGGHRRQLTDTGLGGANRWPAWSPRGTEISFIHFVGVEHARLYAIRPDGSNLRSLSDAPVDVAYGHPPAWSPDGSLIAFSTPLNGRPVPPVGHVPGRDLYVVAADGSSERRLTESAERHVADRRPTWSPDGTQVAFESTQRHGRAESALYAVNADGTCEGRIAGVEGWRPEWQQVPGAAPSTRRCSDLAVVVGVPKGRGQAGRFRVMVLNNGTEPLTGVRLRSNSAGATVLSATSPGARCSIARGGLSCELGRLGAGATVTVAVRAEARILSRIGRKVFGPSATFRAISREAELDLSNNALSNEVVTKSCTVETSGSGAILGTRLDDVVCGRRGRDRIDGLAGDDRIVAGRGDDTIQGGPGDDLIVAGGGTDAVSCGAGVDRVTVTVTDQVAPDCERVSHE